MRGPLCSLQSHRASACLQAPCDEARVCHCVGSLALRRALKAAPRCTLAKLLSGRWNSSLLAGCHRLRRVVPFWCSSCSSSPLLGASLCLLLCFRGSGSWAAGPALRSAAQLFARQVPLALPSPASPKALLAECLLAPKKTSPWELFLIGGFLLFLLQC